MKQPIFYFDKLQLWDKISILLYTLLTILLWYVFLHTTDFKVKHHILFGGAFGTHLFLYMANYKSLRNLTVYFYWFAIGLLHLYLYFQLKDIPELHHRPQHSAVGLRNTLPLLLLFQVLRFISARTQGQELVCPSSGSKTDLFDERNITLIDFILFVIYIGTTLALMV
jgi:hypothetical protein